MALVRRASRTLLVAAAVVPGLVGCTYEPSANKSGAPVQDQVQITLQMPDAGDAQGLYFADAVELRSGGSIHITIDATSYSSSEPSNEPKLARALETGRADIGYLPARAWADGGAFRALLAPFVVTTTSAEQELASGPVADQILTSLPDSVVGVGLVPAEPRRILATRPPDSLAAFSRMRVRIVDNAQSASDFTALGARPVQGMSSDDVYSGLQHDQLDAAETSPTPVLNNGYFRLAHYLSAYAIFPKFQSIVVSRATWTRLSDTQRTAIQQAAADTVAEAGRQLPAQEDHALQRLCDTDVTVIVPTAAQLQALSHAAQVAEDELATDPVAARVLAAIHSLPGAGPKPTASPVPPACLTTAESPAPTPSEGRATIPDGVYVVTMSAADLREGGLIGPKFDHALTETTTFHSGQWTQIETPTYPGQGPWGGPYTIDGDLVTFFYLKPTVNDSPPDTLRWSYFDGLLRFEVVDVTDPAARVMYAAHPWRKID